MGKNDDGTRQRQSYIGWDAVPISGCDTAVSKHV
jgi:hypothetical protein